MEGAETQKKKKKKSILPITTGCADSHSPYITLPRYITYRLPTDASLATADLVTACVMQANCCISANIQAQTIYQQIVSERTYIYIVHG
jgi:hypothetical protein